MEDVATQATLLGPPPTQTMVYQPQWLILLLRGQFQNQPPIGWLKKYKIENKSLLYGTVTYITVTYIRVTYITALLLRTVAAHI